MNPKTRDRVAERYRTVRAARLTTVLAAAAGLLAVGAVGVGLADVGTANAGTTPSTTTPQKTTQTPTGGLQAPTTEPGWSADSGPVHGGSGAS